MINTIKFAVREKLKNIFLESIREAMIVDSENAKSEIKKLSGEVATINNKINILKQTINMLSNKNQTKVIKCLFLVHHVEAWESLDGVYNEMKKDSRFNPIVATINRKFPGSQIYKDEDSIHAHMDKLGVEHIRFNNEDSYFCLDIIKSLSPDVIFRQSQWDVDIPPAFSTDELRFAKLCYIPYEIMNFLDGISNEIYNSHFQHSCSVVFCANVFAQKHKIEKSLLNNNLFVSGHPKVRKIKSAQPDWPIISEENNRKFKVIWGAHHSIYTGWSNFGMFLVAFEKILSFAKENQDIDIVFSPHPALMTMLEDINDIEVKEKIKNFFVTWKNLKNTHIHRFGTYSNMFAASDLLLIDGISWLLEYQVMNKPIVFMERDDHLPFNESGKLIKEGLNSVRTPDEAMALIVEFKNGKDDSKKDAQKKVSSRLLEIENIESCELKILDKIYSEFF